MVQEPRKATEVLLDLESKVDMLLGIIRAQDLNIKVLSNKLNDVIGKLDKQQAAPKFMIEAVDTAPQKSSMVPPGFTQVPAGDPEKNIPVLAETKLPQADAPHGFRRSSRPETFAGDNAILPRPDQEMKMPVQLPKMPPLQKQQPQPLPKSDVTVPPAAMNKAAKQPPPPPPPEMMESQPPPAAGQVPIMQRCVDRNGKSIFLAQVDVVDLQSGQPVFKTRTNGTGKWMASLGIGAYRVTITKQASMGKEKLEAVQDIQVDGTQSPLELPMLLIK